MYYICGFAIPFFFMSSGYFLLNRGKINFKYSIKKNCAIIRIVFIWNLIYLILKAIKGYFTEHLITVNILSIFQEVLKSFAQKGAFSHFWYLGALGILYFLLPVFSKFSIAGKKKTLILFGTIAVFIQLLSFKFKMPVQSCIIQTLRLWTWLFYFILGSLMVELKPKIEKIPIHIHTIICIIFTIVIAVFQNYVGSNLIIESIGLKLHAEYFYDSILEIFWVSFLFLLLLRVNCSKRIKVVISKIVPLTMGIYIIHFELKGIVCKIINVDTFLTVIFYWIVIFLLSAIISYILNCTKLGKYLVRM